MKTIKIKFGAKLLATVSVPEGSVVLCYLRLATVLTRRSAR